MKSKGFIKLKTGNFKFTQVTESNVDETTVKQLTNKLFKELINQLNETRGSGITGIPS